MIRRLAEPLPLRRLLGPFVRATAALGLTWPLTRILSNAIGEIKSATPRSPGCRTIIAFNQERFRSDLQVLADTGEFRVLFLPFYWQKRIIYTFYPDDLDLMEMYRPAAGSFVAKRQALLRRWLRGVLRRLYRQLNIVAAVGAALHYKRDLDFGVASEEIGTPFIVLHRECFLASNAYTTGTSQYYRRVGPFAGSLLIVHNEHTRGIFVDANVAPPANIRSIGVLRMDDYVRRLDANKAAPVDAGRRKLVTFFSFFEGYGQWDLMPWWSRDGKEGFVQLFVQVHVEFAQLALRTPDVDFVIKPKWGGTWLDRIDRALAGAGISVNEIPNLSVIVETDAQALILNSDVITTFGSTVQLEAAIAGKPIVVPRFAEASEPYYQDWLVLTPYDHLFDIAHSPKEFSELILHRLEDWQPDDVMMGERRDAFETWVSSLDGQATERYVSAINEAIEAKSGRTAAAISVGNGAQSQGAS